MAEAPPVRVLFVVTSLAIGGAETQLARLARAWRTDGWPVAVVALRDLPGLAQELADDGIEVARLAGPDERLGPGTLRALAREVHRFAPDVIVTFLFQANVLGRCVGAWARVPVVSSIRNTRFGGGSRLGGLVADALERLTGPLATTVVVNSRLAGDALRARGVVSARRLRIVPNALPPAEPPLDPAERLHARTALGLEAGSFAWLTAGRLEPQKNHDALLAAFAALHREEPRARLLVAGDGSRLAAVRARRDELGLGTAVTLLGFRGDLPRLLRLADGFVLASAWEGLPNVVMEALAAGVPTVATPVGGVPELIVDGVTGWLAASPAPSDLLDAMRGLMGRSLDERARVAAAGRLHVEARFGLRAAVAAWSDIVREATAGATGRQR